MSIISKLTNKWLNQRIPAALKYKLNHKNIFIFPSKFGALFLSLCMLLFLLGTNYQNNLMLLLCYFLLALFLVNLFASYINFSHVLLQQGKSSQVFVGDNLHLPLWLNADQSAEQNPDGQLFFKFKKETKNSPIAVTTIDTNAYHNPVTLHYPCEKRGKLTLPRITVSSYFPLGLFKCWTHLAFNQQITVFPKPVPCRVELSNKNNTKQQKTNSLGQEQNGHDDFSHLKAYQVGESLHHIAWKQVAKGRGMVSKQFSSLTNQTAWLSLPNQHSSAAGSEQEFELTISKLTYQVIELSRKDQVFGLDLGATSIAPNSGLAHTEACLTALALISPTFVS
ncbi:DUF58 domain-containing protein [Paraglaciecola sp.]|uniref:DUF58 domain-containing protein n=1 Tax=Paraglaciecola sp. TaxID=1920173 RepID=UPI003EF52C60